MRYQPLLKHSNTSATKNFKSLLGTGLIGVALCTLTLTSVVAIAKDNAIKQQEASSDVQQLNLSSLKKCETEADRQNACIDVVHERNLRDQALTTATPYVNGKINGVVQVMLEHKLTQEISYQDGKRHGPHLIYNEQGQIKNLRYYEQGEEVFTLDYKQGEVVKARCTTGKELTKAQVDSFFINQINPCTGK